MYYKMENEDFCNEETYDEVEENVRNIQKEITLLTEQLAGWKDLLDRTLARYPINTEIRNKLYDNNIIDSRQHHYVRRSCGHYKRMTVGGRWESCPDCERKREQQQKETK